MSDVSNGFTGDDVGRYIYTGDGWHKILSVQADGAHASVSGSFTGSSSGYEATLSLMNEITISGEDAALTKLEIDYVPRVR